MGPDTYVAALFHFSPAIIGFFCNVEEWLICLSVCLFVVGVPKGSEHKMSRMYEVVRRMQERGVAESAYDESGATKGKGLPY